MDLGKFSLALYMGMITSYHINILLLKLEIMPSFFIRYLPMIISYPRVLSFDESIRNRLLTVFVLETPGSVKSIFKFYLVL